MLGIIHTTHTLRAFVPRRRRRTQPLRPLRPCSVIIFRMSFVHPVIGR